MLIQKEIESYWESRADVYSQSIKEELNSFKREVWQDLISKHVREKGEVKALDVGCGPGFFTILMSELDYEVTAVDCTLDMLAEARENTEAAGYSAEFLKGDVHSLPFADNSFDLIVCRNLVWNLVEPKRAYREWYRILKPGGSLVVFDANWYLRLQDISLEEENKKAARQAQQLGYEDSATQTQKKECAQIAKKLTLSYELRPNWDQEVLTDCGFAEVVLDFDISDKVWNKAEQIRYQATPMFSVAAYK